MPNTPLPLLIPRTSALSNGAGRMDGAGQSRRQQTGQTAQPGAGWDVLPISLYLSVLTCHLADAFRADDQVHSDVPSLLE